MLTHTTDIIHLRKKNQQFQKQCTKKDNSVFKFDEISNFEHLYFGNNSLQYY